MTTNVILCDDVPRMKEGLRSGHIHLGAAAGWTLVVTEGYG